MFMRNEGCVPDMRQSWQVARLAYLVSRAQWFEIIFRFRGATMFILLCGSLSN